MPDWKLQTRTLSVIFKRWFVRYCFTLTILVLLDRSYGQECEKFLLSARPDKIVINFREPLVFRVTLKNESDKTVTVVSREMPNGWSIYRSKGKAWVPLTSGGLVRGSVSRSFPEQSGSSAPDLFPNEEYKQVEPGGALDNRYDLSDQVWTSLVRQKIGPTVKLRVVLRYRYEPSPAESKLGMLKCDLQTEPRVVTINNISPNALHLPPIEK